MLLTLITLPISHTDTENNALHFGNKLCPSGETVNPKTQLIIIIIIIFIYCNWAVTRWQWLFYMYTKLETGYY